MPDPASPGATPPLAVAPSRRGRRADAVLVAVAVGFAFLAASFAATNSDLWLHLAAGRLLATGGYTFGVDPFAYTTDGVYWANHAWLFDLLLYGAYQLVGGAGLVALKAAAVAATAGLMLRVALREGGPVWVGVGCVLLAVLAISPRALLQPACASLLFLAACLYLLRAGGRAHRFLPAVVTLWVNIDGWFLLGPLLVALYALGERLGRSAATEPRLPLWLLPACLAACLCSPHHVRALTPPPELSPAVWNSELRDDPRFAGFFAHTWNTAPRDSPAAWACLVLAAAGAASFAVNRRAALGWRGPVWLAFAALGAWQVRLVPFFAVVAGPITALNLREVLAPNAALRAGRIGVLFAGLVLIGLAWPGWLQGTRSRDRAVAWRVAPDPSLVRAADTLTRWRDNGTLPAGAQVFTTHPDVAHHLAWFAPGEKGFLDSRLQLFTHVARQYAAHSRALGVLPEDATASTGSAFGCAVLYDPDARAFAAGLRAARPDAGRWRVLRIDGHAVLVAHPTALPAVPTFDAEALAFGRPPDDVLPPAPGDGPAALPTLPSWWAFAAPRARPRSWEGDAAGTYLRLFEVELGSAGRGAPSPALPLLAVRAARGAVAKHSDNDDAWLALGRAYLALGHGTWDADAAGDLSPLRYLRHAQVAAALVQAVTIDPDSPTAHEALAGAFAERQFLDLALTHRRAHLRLVTRAGPAPGEPVAAHADRLARLADAADELENAVQDAENRFVVRTVARAGDPLARAGIARDLGLPGKAIDTLLKSHFDLYGPDGLRLLIDLQTQTGQAADVRLLLDRDELRGNPGVLRVYELPGPAADGRRRYGLPAYEWFDLCQCAAAGRYDRAAAALDRLRGWFTPRASAPELRKALRRAVLAEAGLGLPPAAVLARTGAQAVRASVADAVRSDAYLRTVRADLHVLGGVLQLERGLPAAAADDFAQALDLYDRVNDVAPALAGRPLAARYADAIRQHAK